MGETKSFVQLSQKEKDLADFTNNASKVWVDCNRPASIISQYQNI